MVVSNKVYTFVLEFSLKYWCVSGYTLFFSENVVVYER